MATYSIDIGFNRDLLRHPATSLAALLSQGVTQVCVIGNPVHVARTFEKGDQLVITAYDLSKEHTEINAMSFELVFSPALPDQQEVCPIAGGPEFLKSKIYSSEGPGESTVFEECKWRYIIKLDAKPKAKGDAFPCSQLQKEKLEVDPTPIPVVNTGHFYYTILLSVTWDDDPVPKSFRVDPEMITTNGEPLPTQGGR